MSNNEPINQNRRRFLKYAAGSLGGIVVGGMALSFLSKGGLNADPRDHAGIGGQASHPYPDDPSNHWGFVIDLAKCDGCEGLEPNPREIDPTGEKPRCTFACRIGHKFTKADPPQYWIRVYHLQDNPSIPPYYFPKPCQNCQDPPCEHVCPTGATFKRKDGTVLINQEICIGCRICMAACPYETRFFWYNNPDPEENMEDGGYAPERPWPHTRGTVTKCDYCIHEVVDGRPPHCVAA